MPQIFDWPGRMKQLAAFVGLELDLIKLTSDAVLKNADDLTAAVYDNFLKFPETRRFFLESDGDGTRNLIPGLIPRNINPSEEWGKLGRVTPYYLPTPLPLLLPPHPGHMCTDFALPTGRQHCFQHFQVH